MILGLFIVWFFSHKLRDFI